MDRIFRGQKIRRRTGLSGSFTIEAALLVPLVLAVIFMTLQLALYLHDSVWAGAWVHYQAWRLRVETEGGREAEPGEVRAPVLFVLRFAESETVIDENLGGDRICFAACFDVGTAAGFGTLIFGGQPSDTWRRAEERVIDTPFFLRIAGAILEGEK